MRSLITVIVAIVAGSWCPTASSADFWKKKDYSEWTDQEVGKLLADSPWARSVTIGTGGPPPSTGMPEGSGGRRRSAGMEGAPTTGAGGGRGGETGSMDGGSSSGRRPMGTVPTLLVRWTSALPVKLAMARQKYGAAPPPAEAQQLLAREESSYVVTVHGLPRGLSRMDPARLREALKNLTRLERKGKDPIPLEDVQLVPLETGGVIVAFIFPRTAAITLEDREVAFVTKMGSIDVKRKFSLRDMVFEGKLQL
jgi:hypothetical protein